MPMQGSHKLLLGIAGGADVIYEPVDEWIIPTATRKWPFLVPELTVRCPIGCVIVLLRFIRTAQALPHVVPSMYVTVCRLTLLLSRLWCHTGPSHYRAVR